MDEKKPDRRSSPRVPIRSDKPVYVSANIAGVDSGLLVENLSTGGATLICPENSDSFRSGDRLEDCAIVLPEIGRVPVNVFIHWSMWPKLGVQFDGLAPEGSEKIARFLKQHYSIR